MKRAKGNKISKLKIIINEQGKELSRLGDLEKLLEATTNLVAGIHWWKDKNGVYRGCNQAMVEQLGLQSKFDIIGKTDYQLPWAEQAGSLVANDNEVMRTRTVQKGKEELVASKNGLMHTFMVAKSPIYDAYGEVIGTVGNSIDITDRKEMEEALYHAKEAAEAANKAKTEFLENMRHDIRTPLTGIVGFASIIADEANDPKIKEYTDNLTASSNALQDLLNEILEVIRIGSHELPLLKKKFDLHKKLADVINLNKAKALHKHLILEFEYDKNIPAYVIGDSTRIHRIALELLTNALNFTDKGLVKLTVKLAKKIKNKLVIKIIVEDTGIGIPFDKKDEIFLQFKRLTPSYKGIYKGAGLGLTIIKEFIDELDGEIYVESQEGKGSKFTCVLPLKKPLLDEELSAEMIVPSFDYISEQLMQTQITLTKEVEPTITKNKSRVLLVEDETLAAKVANNILTNLNCNISWANNGKTAIELFQNDHYDIVFMDVGLPDIDGYEVARRIRLFELNQETHVPIIALTAHVDEENKQHCINVGMNAVLSKPLNKDKAKDILNAFIPYREHPSETTQAVKQDVGAILPEDKVIDFELLKQMYGNNLHS